MKNWRIIVRITLFCVIFVVIFVGFSRVLTPKWLNVKQYDTFTKRPDGYVDVLFVGSSSMYAGLSPLTMWKTSGVSSQLRASTMQAPHMTYALLEDALNRQKPKLVVLGTLYLFDRYNMDACQASTHMELDAMPLSLIKLSAIRTIIQNSSEQHFIDYLFPFFRYHDRWNQITNSDLSGSKGYDYVHGQHMVFGIKDIADFHGNMTPEGEAVPAFNPDSLAYYQKAVALCQSKEIPVVILAMPRTNWSYARHEGTQKFADMYGIEFIDLNSPGVYDKLNIDVKADYYNENHLNVNGADKVSAYLAQYLAKQYNIPDRRGDQSIAPEWNADVKRFEGVLKNTTMRIIPASEPAQEDDE